MLLVGGMVLLGVGAAAAYGAVKISQKDKDRIEEHSGESVEEMSEEELVQAMKADLWDAVEAGTLGLPIDREFSLDDAPAAVDYMKANRHFGKIVLNVDA